MAVKLGDITKVETKIASPQYRAADGTPVTVQLDATGMISDATGTGTDQK